MAKIKLRKNAVIAIIVIAAILAAAGVSFGVIYGVTLKKLDAPVPEVKAVLGEPDYTINFAWAPVERALSYKVEYAYGLEPGKVYTVDTKATELTVKRLRGSFKYRVKALGKYAANTSEFSEWRNYEVAAMQLDRLLTFNFKKVGDSYYVDMDTFTPVTYTYKGVEYTVNYYEMEEFGPGENREEAIWDPAVISLTDMPSINSPYAEGEWQVYMRPVTYVKIHGIADYTQPTVLYELYETSTEYTVVQLAVD